MPFRAFRLALVIASAQLAAGCRTTPTAIQLPPGGRRVLFIGNSLTTANDLPATVAAIAASAGDTIRVMTVAGPNLAAIDHADGLTNAVATIRAGSWNHVVLQQG